MNHMDLSACLRALRCIEGDDLRAAGIPMSAVDERAFIRDPEFFYLRGSDERQKAMFRIIASRCRNLSAAESEDPLSLDAVAAICRPAPAVPLNAAEILDATAARRERNRPIAEAGNAARESEDSGALSLR